MDGNEKGDRHDHSMTNFTVIVALVLDHLWRPVF